MNGPKMRKLCLFLVVTNSLSAVLSCGGRTILHAGITQYDKTIILDAHNRARQLVALGQVANQPPAQNMAKMIWSEELAAKAQEWAMQCSSYVHDPNRHRGRHYVGQNIATKWSTRAPENYYESQADWTGEAISKWFDENRFYNFNGFRGGKTAHYTQMVWAETAAVGCGFVYYLDGKRYTKKYVCNYGPSGNVQGEVPYEKGYPSCSSHGLIESRSYPGLCEKFGIDDGSHHYDNNFVYEYYTYVG
ncbi:venom allergen 5 isoform X1 [Tribolium castaneum]|nr:PREDICTED: venom allergen 5 isoform X1 [Tribolium castaneum]|eukprot:XP_008201046.1 PREDICTED: venom allergen 5 isoform X1 [Tribolium castaneum]